MAKPIKDTPVLTGSSAKAFLERQGQPKKISREELDKREKSFNALESIRKF